MVKHVVKRDGRVVIFDKRKIVDAILKAMEVTETGEDIVLAAEIASAISKINVDNMSVEEIQDQVENELMNSPRQEVAKKYIAYRNQRNLARKAKSREIFQEIIDAQATEITRENANMNADTPAGMMMKFASESTKSYVDECMLSDDVKEAVKNNYIHIHDKDYYPTKSLTCIQDPRGRFLCRTRRVSSGKENRDSQHSRMYFYGNSSERDARRPGHPCIRLLYGSFREKIIPGRA